MQEPTKKKDGIAGLPGRSHYPPGTPDWAYWKNRNSWIIAEAVCLIHNYDPGKLENKNHPIYDRYNSPDDPKAQELRATCVAAITAVKLKRLAAVSPSDPSRADRYTEVNPGKFITWAKKRGFNVPDALEVLAHRMILDGREVDAGHPILKRIEEKEVQEHKKNPPPRENAKPKTIFTAKEIDPISALEASENYKIFPQQQLSHIDEGKLDPYERIPGDSRPRLDFPSMPPSDAPDPTIPRYRCLQKYERGRLTVEKLKELFYPEHQVSRLKADNDENHERLIWNKFIQPIIDAYDIKTVKYKYNPCSYNPAADNKMRRLLVQMTNKRKPLESFEQPLEKFKQLLRLWAEGNPDEPGCKYKQFFIQFMGHLEDDLTLPHFLWFLDEYCLADEQLAKAHSKNRLERFIKWIEFDRLMERWNLTKFELMQVIKYGKLPAYSLPSELKYMEDIIPFPTPIQDWSVQADHRPERLVFNPEDIERLDSEFISVGAMPLT